jgi:hypothetical protein
VEFQLIAEFQLCMSIKSPLGELQLVIRKRYQGIM